ncbi:HEAT repeat domain-containing protein [Polyangium aurulentum]|uniref:HEAT repeat domain-containing protein n=1 Tax=Polyangium aurulentum TaxID=2567896 RepID=UPI0010ADB432|nr:HEAT repeat domain-containing protein [Polyangium aurulentum]UQA63162.1 HEAT repeat domain-containing protein [Polyangium aurulentum]
MTASVERTKGLAESVRATLEASLLVLADRSDATDAADAVRAAIARISKFVEAEALGVGPIEHLESAEGLVRAARERLSGDETTSRRLESAARWLREASGSMRERLLSRTPEQEPSRAVFELLASVGVPRAHRVEVPPPRVLAREDLLEETGAPFRGALGAGPGVAGELAQLRQIARDCLEDLASLGSLRRLHDWEPWIDARTFEQRLLDNLDALVSLELPLDPRAPSVGLVDELWRYATEWAVPDLGRTFALAFTLCCLSSETALRWVVLALRRSHPRTHPAFVDALALGSNGAIDRVVAELCGDDDPAIAAVGLEAAARRGRADVGSTLLLLQHPSAALVCRAIEVATRLPVQVSLALLSRLLDGGEPVVAATAASALCELGDPRGVKHLRHVLGHDPGSDREALRARRIALETLCLLGSAADRRLVAAAAGASSEGLDLLGWHGHPEHVPVLLEALRRLVSAGGSVADAARIARALERIGGGAVPRPGAMSHEFEPALAAWARSFEERRPADGARLRFGERWTASATVAELATPATKQEVRPLLARELALATQGAMRLDVTGWVAAQQQELARFHDALARQG